jgi:hypothetical protein
VCVQSVDGTRPPRMGPTPYSARSTRPVLEWTPGRPGGDDVGERHHLPGSHGLTIVSVRARAPCPPSLGGEPGRVPTFGVERGPFKRGADATRAEGGRCGGGKFLRCSRRRRLRCIRSHAGVAESPETTASPAVPSRTAVDPTPADSADVLRATVVRQVMSSLPSPDGEMRAEILTYACTPAAGEQAYALDQFVTHGSSPESSWVADEQLQACGGLGGMYWSPDSRRFYYTPAREGVPDGRGMWWAPLDRVCRCENQGHAGAGCRQQDSGRDVMHRTIEG